MEIDQFKSMVARLEQESAAAPRQYRIKVALLALLGFAILALVLATVCIGLVALVGIAGALMFTGGAALILLLKLGKLLFLLAIPLWFTLKSAVQSLFVRLPAPALFEALDASSTTSRKAWPCWTARWNSTPRRPGRPANAPTAS